MLNITWGTRTNTQITQHCCLVLKCCTGSLRPDMCSASPSPPYKGKTNCYFCKKEKRKKDAWVHAPGLMMYTMHHSQQLPRKREGGKGGGWTCSFCLTTIKCLVSIPSYAWTCVYTLTNLISMSLIYHHTTAIWFKYTYRTLLSRPTYQTTK